MPHRAAFGSRSALQSIFCSTFRCDSKMALEEVCRQRAQLLAGEIDRACIFSVVEIDGMQVL